MQTNKFQILFLVLIATILMIPSTALAWTTFPLVPSESEVADALDYLEGQQTIDGSITDFGQSPWVVMAIAASNDDANKWETDGNSIMDYLSLNADNAQTPNEYSNMILAAVAGFADPTDFGGRDFTALLEAEYDGAQIGNSTAINDDAWGIMALIAAGVNQGSPIITNSASFIRDNQNPDGGWGWNAIATSDADSTTAPIMALIAAGENANGTPIQNALAYLKTQQMANGGFDSWGSTNADTNAWVISALVAVGEDPTGAAWQIGGNSPVDDLVNHQATNGSYEWQPGNAGFSPTKTTNCSTIALLGKSYPIQTPERVMLTTRIEGTAGTIWSDETTVLGSTIMDNTSTPYWIPNPTALGALDEAAQSGGFTCSLTDWGGGPGGLFVDTIDGIGGVSSWWLYRVDNLSPAVGAGAFALDVTDPPTPPHTEVIWYESLTFAEQPIKLELDNTSVVINEPCTAIVSLYNDGSATWSPLAGATVHADTDYLTGIDGTIAISVDQVTTLNVYAEMGNCIRSNRVTLTVEWSALGYDSDQDDSISKQEALNAVTDFFGGKITKQQALDVIVQFFS